MRKKLIITAVLASVMVMCFAQKPHKIMFYNMENFFDTIDDPETNDEEFLPDGAKRWNTAKYDKKLRNMERVLFDIAAIDRMPSKSTASQLVLWVRNSIRCSPAAV